MTTCSKCSQEFDPRPWQVINQCKQCPTCRRARDRAYIAENRDRKRAWNNAYSSRMSSERSEKTRAYRDQYPEKKSAHQAVQTALRNGTLARNSCAVCGSERTHAHHDDYSRPLDVELLCHSHHMQKHAMLKVRDNG